MNQRKFTLATLALFAALAVPASAAQKGVQTDLTSGLNGNKRSRTVAGVQDLGANWMRLTMSWSEIEQSGKGSYSMLDRYDNGVREARRPRAPRSSSRCTRPRSGRRAGRTPTRHRSTPMTTRTSCASRPRAGATRSTPGRSGTSRTAARFWSTGPSPSGYAQLLKAAYPAVKHVDPTALVVYGGVSHNDYRFIEQSYAAEPNLGDYYDVMATHPYPTAANLAPERTWLESDGRLAVSRSLPTARSAT